MTSVSEGKNNELSSLILVTHILDRCQFLCHILVALPMLFWRNRLHWASSFRKFLHHTQRRTELSRTSLDGWSARLRDLYLTTHNTLNWQTSIPPREIRIHSLSRRAAADLRLRPRPLGPANLHLARDINRTMYFVIQVSLKYARSSVFSVRSLSYIDQIYIIVHYTEIV